MQERKVVVTRILTSARLFPQAKETPQERISRFINAQKQVVAYPFSPDISVKSLGRSASDPSADNKEKRKKAKSKFMRMGTGIFDPDAKAKPGQYFEIRPRKINQNGQMGDVANMGWLDPRKKIAPKNMVEVARRAMAEQRNKVSVRVVSANKNKRTGAIEAKSLGRTIGQSAGNIGQAAARAIGIVVDSDGKFRCPPGVPAANQFTDEVGSNCFDFSPLVARAMVGLAQRFGFKLQDSIRKIDAATPFSRDSKGTLRERTSLRSTGTPTLLGPDGRPISRETLEAESVAGEARRASRELAVAEEELATIGRGTGEIVDPDTYEEKFKTALRKAYPELSSAEINELAKTAAQREKMKDEIRRQQRDALEIIRSLGIEVDESDPASVQRGTALALHKLREEGWNIDLRNYYGENFHDNPEMAMLQHRRNLALIATESVQQAIYAGKIEGISDKELKKINEKYGDEGLEKIISAIQNGTPPKDVFPDDEKAQTFLSMAMLAHSKAQSYEVGTMMQIIRQRRQSPEMTNDIGSINIVQHDPDDPFFAECYVENGRIGINIDIIGTLVSHPAETLNDSGFHLYEPSGTAGTEIAKLQAIGEVVTAENRRRLLGSYLGDLKSFSEQVRKIKEGSGYQTELTAEHFGGMAHGLFIMNHELVHGRQLKIVSEFIKSRNPGMTNAEALEVAREICIEGVPYTDASGQEFDYASIISNPAIMSSAIGNIGEIIGVLVDNKVGGVYGPSHYYTAFYLNELAKAGSIEEMEEIFKSLNARNKMLAARGETPESQGLNRALGQAQNIVSAAQRNGFDETAAMRQGVNRWAGITFLEMQADISAGVEMGLIEKTPEIEAFLAPLHLGKDLDKVREAIVPPVELVETRKEKLKRIGRMAKRISRSDINQIIESAQKISSALEMEERDRRLTSLSLKSTASFDGRGDVSRWGKSVRDAVMESATPQQQQVLESKWRNRRWAKPTSEMSIINSLALGEGEKIINEIENEFIPFVDLVGNSFLPNGVAAEIVVPFGSVGWPATQYIGGRYELSNHFTGLLKSTDDLFTTQAPDGPLSTQRLILNVPEGFSGLPDYTPGTGRGEVGSIILPPGEIEIIDVRDDGVAMASLISQERISETLAKKKGELRRAEEKTSSLDDKITLRKAINRVERREQAEQKRSLRSAGRGEVAVPRPNTQVPSEPDAQSVAIKDRMEAQGITWGKPVRQRLNELRDQLKAKRDSSRGIVTDETHDFESPEEAKVRVDKALDNAVAQLKVGKLPGLSPEVSEIMKDKSPEEIRQILVETLKKQVEGLDKRARFRIRGSGFSGIRDGQDSPLMGFIKTGRWRTTHDSSGSQAASDPKKRKTAELLLGIPESADDSLRPAHGYYLHVDELEFQAGNAKRRRKAIEENSFGENMDMFNEDVLTNEPGGQNLYEGKTVDPVPYQYGLSEIVLRPEASQRTVITFGDSLNGLRTPVALDGSATDDELLEAGLLQRSSAIDSGMFGGPRIDTTQSRIAALLDASVSKNHAHVTAYDGQGATGRYYTEAIVGGGFTMDDVEEIRIEPDFQQRYMSEGELRSNDVSPSTARQVLSGVMPDKDIQLVEKMLSEEPQENKKNIVKSIRELLADRANLSLKLRERKRVRSEIESRVSDPTGKKPKVTFLDRRGNDFERHSSYPTTMKETGLTEDHDIEDLVKRGAAVRIRNLIKDSGIPVSSDEEFEQTKPQAMSTLRSGGAVSATPKQSLRSAGAMVIDDSGISRRLGRRTSSLRSSGRTTSQKINEGPSDLDYGLDDKSLPRVATTEENKTKFGRTPKQVKQYFSEKWGIDVKGGLPDGQKHPEEEAAAYAAMQALDDVLNNLGDVAKLLKKEKFKVNFNSGWTARSATMGSFGLDRRVLFGLGKQKLQLEMYPKNIVDIARKDAEQLRQNGIRGLGQSRGIGLVSEAFTLTGVGNVSDADMDLMVAQRMTYGNMVHEMGHLLDYLGRDASDGRVRLKPIIPMWITGAEGEEIKKRIYQSGQISEIDSDYANIPSVSGYGSSSPQESLAEAWTAWFLFSRRPDIQVRPWSSASQGGRMMSATQSLSGAAQAAVRPLFESLGDGIKTAEQTDDYEETTEIPFTVLLYAFAPFIIDKEEKK